VGAHSFDGVERRANVDSVEEYLARESPLVSREPVDRRRRAEERLLLGLRQTAGVALTPGDHARYGAEIERLAAAGLLDFSGGRLRLTPRGLLLSNEVFQVFV
jgi:oxygen-independent coproporphyrinogen-3 oxidase